MAQPSTRLERAGVLLLHPGFRQYPSTHVIAVCKVAHSIASGNTGLNTGGRHCLVRHSLFRTAVANSGGNLRIGIEDDPNQPGRYSDGMSCDVTGKSVRV